MSHCGAPPGQGTLDKARDPAEAGRWCGGGGFWLAPKGGRGEALWQHDVEHMQGQLAISPGVIQVGRDDCGDGGQVMVHASQDVSGLHGGRPTAARAAEANHGDVPGVPFVQDFAPTMAVNMPAALAAASHTVKGTVGQQQAWVRADLLEALGDADYDGDKPSWWMWCGFAVPTLPQRPNLTSDLAHKNPVPRSYAAAPDSCSGAACGGTLMFTTTRSPKVFVVVARKSRSTSSASLLSRRFGWLRRSAIL